MPGKSRVLNLTVDVVTAYLTRNPLGAGAVPALITQVHRTLCSPDAPPSTPRATEATPLTRAQIRSSIRKNALISFEDGRAYKSLTRHIKSRGMTFTDYRLKWGLPVDYPSVARGYSESRAALAKRSNFGRSHRSGPDKPGPKGPAPARAASRG